MANHIDETLAIGDNDIPDIHDNGRKRDPQIVVTGQLKEGPRADVIVFSIPLALLELVCIVTIPAEGTSVVPVYVKFKIKRG